MEVMYLLFTIPPLKKKKRLLLSWAHVSFSYIIIDVHKDMRILN